MANVTVGLPTSTTATVEKVVIMANNTVIGQAQPTNTYSWNMPWVTQLWPNGGVNVKANVFYAGMSTPCSTSTAAYTQVQNTTTSTSTIQISVTPSSWQGPINNSFQITSNTYVPLVPFNATQYTFYEWTANIGTLSPQGNRAQFSSGQTAGTGQVTIKASYGGRSSIVSVPVKIESVNAPLQTTTTTSTTTSTNPTTSTTSVAAPPTTDTTSSTTTNIPDSTSTTTEPTATTSSDATQQPVLAQNCALSTLGQERYTAINSGNARLTTQELSKIKVCFASSNYVLSSNFSPVPPAQVKSLSSTKKINITKLENTTKKDDTGQRESLRLTGKATPNSIVLIYIFSDPLILTTTAGKDGNWEYVLEDPLTPGKHEVYSAVDKGDGVYERSDPWSFVVGTAEASTSNPNGLSLRLAETPTPVQSKRSMLMYIAGSVTALLIAFGALIVIIKLLDPNALFNFLRH